MANRAFHSLSRRAEVRCSWSGLVLLLSPPHPLRWHVAKPGTQRALEPQCDSMGVVQRGGAEGPRVEETDDGVGPVPDLVQLLEPVLVLRHVHVVDVAKPVLERRVDVLDLDGRVQVAHEDRVQGQPAPPVRPSVLAKPAQEFRRPELDAPLVDRNVPQLVLGAGLLRPNFTMLLLPGLESLLVFGFDSPPRWMHWTLQGSGRRHDHFFPTTARGGRIGGSVALLFHSEREKKKKITPPEQT